MKPWRKCCATELGGALVSQIGGLLTRRAFARFRQRVDYAEYGAAPLLGVAGLALIGHGRSSARAVQNGVALAARLAEAGVAHRLADALSAVRADHAPPGEHNGQT